MSKKIKKTNICTMFFKLFKNPSQAFKEIDAERGIGGALIILIISIILGRLLVFLVNMFSNRSIISLYIQRFEFTSYLTFAAIQLISAFLISIGLLIMLKIFKTKAKLSTVFKIVCFSAPLYLIFGALPFFSVWVFPLSAFFVIYGFKELFKISGLRSTLIVLTSYLIFWIGRVVYGLFLIKETVL